MREEGCRVIKKVPPRWQRLGFSSEEEMNRHGAICKRRKAQIDHLAELFDRGLQPGKKAGKETEEEKEEINHE